MISHGTPRCISDSWMYSKVHISSAVIFFILVTIHQGTCATLKGQKAVFKLTAPDEYGTLSPGTNIPSLGSFTLCIDIRLRQNNNNRMIAFTYNTDIKRMHSGPHHELGIMIKDRKLVIWLFHKQLHVKKDIPFASWHSVCLTWNGNTHETHVYLNRTHVLSKTLNNAYSLGQNGSLVLGRKHSRGADRLRLDRKIFVGDLYLFRLWDHAKERQSISQLNCEDGNVITWDSQQWDFVGSILKYDPSLPCSRSVLKSRFKRSANTMIPSGRPGKLSVADPKYENTDSSIVCDNDQECENPEESLPTGSTAHLGSTSSEVTLSPSSTKEISMPSTGTSSPPNMTEISTTPTKISSPPNTTESSTPTEISSPSNTTEINTILTGTSPRLNITENSTTPTGTSSQGNRTGNSFTNATISPMTENSTALTGISSPANATENSTAVTGSLLPWDRTENSTALTGISSPANATVNSTTVSGSSIPWDRTDHTTITGTSSPSNTTGNSFTNTAISPLTENSTAVTGSLLPWDRTENSTALTGISSPANATVNNTTATGSSSPQDRTANSLTNATISPITENSTAVTGSLLPWDRTVSTMTTTVTSSPQNTTENFISNMTNSPETANSTTITGTSSSQNTTGNSLINMTISFGTGNSVTNNSTSPGTENSIPTNGTSAPQITTVNITTGIETSLPQITTVNNSPVNGTSTTQNTTVYSTSSPQDTTATSTTINETLSTQKTTGNSTTKIRTQPGTVYIITVNKTSTTQNTTGMTIATNRTSTSQTMPVNSTIITTSSPLQNTTVNRTETETSSQNTTVNSTIITTSSPLQNTTEDPLMISPTDASAVALIVAQLEKILQMESINEKLAATLVNTISNLINASVDAVASSSRQILDIVDTIGEKLNFTTDSINITSPFLALAVNKIDATAFSGADFSISNITNLQVSLDDKSPEASFAAIELPPSLFKNFSSEEVDNVSTLQFSFHEKPTLFQDSNMGNASDLNSYIIASSVNANISISDLADPVKITFKHLKLTENGSIVECVFWDFLKNNASGGWNSEGCTTAQTTSNQTVCECNHLTHFGVLLTISRDPITDPVQERILTFITYIGCGLSSICLAMTLVTYLVFEKLRRDYPSKILINLCTALLFLNMVFLIDSWISVYRIEGLCIAVAALLHYFLLASFTWMSLEALHMYLALVKVFNTYVRRYILKFCILGWGIPIVVVAIILGTGAMGRHNYGIGPYGRKTNTTLDEFCWINNDTTFYVAAVGYFCIMFLVNLSMFIVVLTQLCQIKSKQHHQNAQKSVLQNIRSVAGLTFLLGITWGFAFFAWGPVNLPFMYLFAIFNTLQGAFIFIFHCVIKENVQKVWRRYLCCGKLMLPENSDWSITATHNTKKLQPLAQGMSLSSTSNNSLQSTSPLYPVRDYSCHPNVNGAKL